MKVGVPTEIKTDEYRVSLTPAGARELVEHGHEVIVQSGAGEGTTIPDSEYLAQGARIAPDAASVFEEAELVLGVKEPQPQEVAMLRRTICCSPTCTWRPTPSSRAGWPTRAPPASPTRRSSTSAAGCRCWRR